MFDFGDCGVKPSAHIPGQSGCDVCQLYRHCKHPRLGVTGQGKRGVMFIAEAPGKQEDEFGVQLVGSAGQILRQTLRRLGWSLDEDCWKVNAVQCRPSRKLTMKEINACRSRVFQQIEEHDPDVIVLLGTTAIQSVIHPYWSKDTGTLDLWRGLSIPLNGRWVCPTMHPSYIEYMDRNPAVRTIFGQDIEAALALAGSRPDVPEIRTESLSETRTIKRALMSMSEARRPVAFDYEATGLKLDAPGHKLYSVGLSNEPGYGVAFRITDDIRELFVHLLTDPDVPKMAQNIGYEERVSRAMLGCSVSPWVCDTMLCAHQEDNRRGYTGLKFQAFASFGLSDYSKGVDKYLKPSKRAKKEQGANAVNSIEGAPVNDVLKYNAMDAAITLLKGLEYMERIKGE